MFKRTKLVIVAALSLALTLSMVNATTAARKSAVFALGEETSTPIVISTTHPDSSLYYSNNDPVFSWSYTSTTELKGYSYLLSQSELTEPDSTIVEYIVETYMDIPDGTWYFHVKAIDINDVASGTAHYKINVDTTSPTGSIVINGGAEWTGEPTVALSLSASDELSGVKEMRLALSAESLALEPYKPFTETDSITLQEPNGLKTIYAQFRDAAGNESAVFSDDIELRIDHTPPSTPIITSSTHPDSSRYYNTYNAEFAFSATDDQSGVAGYSYVFDQAKGTIPQEVVNDTSGALSIGNIADGTWYLHVRAVDGKGNWGETAHFAIKIDTVAPEGSVVINGGAEQTDDVNVTLSFSATDALSGITEMRYAESLEALAAASYQPFSESASFTLSDIDGDKTVYAQFKDAAGNESAIVSDTIKLAPTPYEGLAKLSIGINGKWFKPGDKVIISGKLTDQAGKGLARYPIYIKVRGKIVATVRSEVGGGYSFEDKPPKTTPYKAVFIDKDGNKIETRAVVAHVKKAKKSKKVKKVHHKIQKAKAKRTGGGKIDQPVPIDKTEEATILVSKPETTVPTEPAPVPGKGKGKSHSH